MACLWAFVSVLALTLRQTMALSISDIPQCAVRGINLSAVFESTQEKAYRKKPHSQA